MAGRDSEAKVSTLLKPFHDRAKLAEDRLEKIEAALESYKNINGPSGDSTLLESLLELRKKLDESRAEQLADREAAAKALATMSAEKEKLRYQISHLKRSLEDADRQLMQKASSTGS